MGHVWTVLPHLRNRIGGGPAAGLARAGAPWSVVIPDARHGAVRLTGVFAPCPGAATVALVVHGLGGSAEAGYCLDAARACTAAGWACLRVNLRGADHLGQDLYHAGLASDLQAMVDAPALAGFGRIVVIGYSLGGHVALRYGLNPDPRVASIVAVCAPLDLGRSAAAFDRRRARPYRMHVLRELQAAYRTMARRGAAPAPMDTIAAVTKIRDWDRHAVVPRFGFADVADYYARCSVGPRLSQLKVPSVYVGAPFDPMVPAFTVHNALAAAGPTVQVHWLDDAGHVGFADPAMADRFVQWADARARG